MRYLGMHGCFYSILFLHLSYADEVSWESDHHCPPLPPCCWRSPLPPLPTPPAMQTSVPLLELFHTALKMLSLSLPPTPTCQFLHTYLADFYLPCRLSSLITPLRTPSGAFLCWGRGPSACPVAHTLWSAWPSRAGFVILDPSNWTLGMHLMSVQLNPAVQFDF